METLIIQRAKPINSKLLIAELAAQITTPFSLATGENKDGYYAQVSSEDSLSAEEQAAAQQIVETHDETQRTDDQVKVDQKINTDRLAALLMGGIDFEALDAQIDNMTWQEGIKGLSRGLYLLAVLGGVAGNTAQAETAALQLGQYFGLLDAAKDTGA